MMYIRYLTNTKDNKLLSKDWVFMILKFEKHIDNAQEYYRHHKNKVIFDVIYEIRLPNVYYKIRNGKSKLRTKIQIWVIFQKCDNVIIYR